MSILTFISAASSACALAAALLLWRLSKKKNRQEAKIEECLKQVKSLRSENVKIAQALRAVMDTQINFYGRADEAIVFTAISMQWIAAAIAPYLNPIIDQAVDEDNLEAANTCKQILDSLRKLSQHRFKHINPK